MSDDDRDYDTDGPLRSLALLADFRSTSDAMPADIKRRMKERYLATDRDNKLRAKIDKALQDLALCRTDGSRFEARGVVLTAGSGSGKSHAVTRVLTKHPLFSGYGKLDSRCIAIGVRCKGSFTLGVLGAELSAAAGYPIHSQQGENIIWRKLRKTLKQRGIVLVHIDEVNSMLRNANSLERGKIVDTLKGLQNDETWPLVVILSGTPRTAEIIKEFDVDKELERRMKWLAFEPLHLPRDIKMIASHVRGLCEIAQLACDETFQSNLVPRLIHAARYQLGSSIEMSIEAIEIAYKEQAKTLVTEHFTSMFAAKYGLVANNPFAVADWASIKIFDKDEKEFDPTARQSKPGKRQA